VRHTSRRSEPDPLLSMNEPSWLVVRDAFRNAQEITPLPRMANIREILEKKRSDHIADGWAAEEIGRRCTFFFCSKDGTRVMVGIEKRDPANPTLGHGPPKSRL